MGPPDAYEVLGVPRDATAVELRSAYRRLALEHHPDRNPGDPDAERRFKEIVLAYERLRDPRQRAAYDAGQRPRGRRGDFDEEWEEIFAQIFRGAHRKEAGEGAPAQARDLRARLDITLEDAAQGAEREIHLRRWVWCDACRGRGADPEAPPAACPLCGGSGELRFKRGLADLAIPCSTCEGKGRYVRERCGACGGEGRSRRESRLRVKVPAAVEDGAQLKLKGKGDESAQRGEAGDLYVGVHIRPHPLFRREGLDILFDLPVSFPQAALGDEVVVPTLNGEVRMRIPAGTQSGRVFRLRGKGLSPAGGLRTGDQRVRVLIETPTRLNERQRRLLEEFQRISTPSTNPRRRKFLEKVKSFLG